MTAKVLACSTGSPGRRHHWYRRTRWNGVTLNRTVARLNVPWYLASCGHPHPWGICTGHSA
jgi:hypothetical protein